jgi:cytidylate kinase
MSTIIWRTRRLRHGKAPRQDLLYSRSIEELKWVSQTVVTLSASYGANGHLVGSAVAEQLGMPFIDAVIPARVGERLGVSAAAADVEQRARSRSRWARFLDSSVYFADIGVATRPEEMYEVVAIASRSRSATEEIIRQAASAGGAVIYGRGAAFVLRDRSHMLRVRLDGPVDRRIAIIAATEGVDEAEAQRLQVETDRAREEYVRRNYGVDPRDSRHYHLVLDSTSLPVSSCVELIVVAATAMAPARAS